MLFPDGSTSILEQKRPLVLTEMTSFPLLLSVSVSSVFCERLHDPHCEAAAGAGHHSGLWVPLRCEFWKNPPTQDQSSDDAAL